MLDFALSHHDPTTQAIASLTARARAAIAAADATVARIRVLLRPPAVDEAVRIREQIATLQARLDALAA